MSEIVETARLRLRPIQMADVDELVALDSDPEVMRYLTGGNPTPRHEVEALVRRRLGSRWMGYRRDDDRFVGWFGLVPGDGGEYDLGYRLRREWWGNGYATEGSLALIDFAFGVWSATRITAQTMAVNTRSRSVMERCGMKFVRTFHLEWDDPLPGSALGEVEYAITREEWLAACRISSG